MHVHFCDSCGLRIDAAGKCCDCGGNAAPVTPSPVVERHAPASAGDSTDSAAATDAAPLSLRPQTTRKPK